MTVDLHRLRFLRELSERGTITATAEALGYTPSAVSQQLSTLERELGTPLLERRGRLVVLTAAGTALAGEADGVFRAAERATAAAEAAAATIAGPVHVGAFQSVGATLVPQAFAELRRSHPDLEVHFRQWADEGLRELKLGHLDICIDQRYSTLPDVCDDHLVQHELLVEPLFLAVPSDGDRGPDLDAYRDQAWAGAPAEHACGQVVRGICGHAGFQPELRFHTDDLEVTLQLVASGLAVSVLPRLAAFRLPENITVHAIPGTHRRVVALIREESAERPAVMLVLEQLRAAGEAIGTTPVAA